jgi:hypothetical protein
VGRGVIWLFPVEWARRRAIADALAAGSIEKTAALLAAGPRWCDPGAARRLEALTARGIDLPGLRIELALAAEPERFADEAARWLATLEPEHWAGVLDAAAAAAQPVELVCAVDLLLGLFDPTWRRGYWPDGFPRRTAPRSVELALGALEPGSRLRSPDDVREAAALLRDLDVDALPTTEVPWADGLDPDGTLDDDLRASLRALVATFDVAARAGCGVRVLAPP